MTLLLAVLVGSAAKPDEWNGLVLDSATPDKATQILGPPAKSEKGQLARLMRKHLVNRSPALLTVKDETVTVMKWEGVAGFKSVSLAFKDGRLRLIQLTPDKHNKIRAADFKSLYENTTVRTFFTHYDLWNKASGISQATGEVRPKDYPTIYYVAGAAKTNTVIVDLCTGSELLVKA